MCNPAVLLLPGGRVNNNSFSLLDLVLSFIYIYALFHHILCKLAVVFIVFLSFKSISQISSSISLWFSVFLQSLYISLFNLTSLIVRWNVSNLC